MKTVGVDMVAQTENWRVTFPCCRQVTSDVTARDGPRVTKSDCLGGWKRRWLPSSSIPSWVSVQRSKRRLLIYIFVLFWRWFLSPHSQIFNLMKSRNMYYGFSGLHPTPMTAHVSLKTWYRKLRTKSNIRFHLRNIHDWLPLSPCAQVLAKGNARRLNPNMIVRFPRGPNHRITFSLTPRAIASTGRNSEITEKVPPRGSLSETQKTHEIFRCNLKPEFCAHICLIGGKQ